jgi:N6-adenosine-specific RNA methylase IME4
MTLEKAKAQRSEVAAGTVSDARPAMGATNGVARKYKIIYADPPWKYDNEMSANPALGGKTYPTMPLEQIKELPVSEMADKDCALFLWGTFPKYQEALDVVRAWGFKYLTAAHVWVKTYGSGKLCSGLGYYTRSNAEPLLLARRGRPLARLDHTILQAFLAPVGRHSEKPAEVREKIVRLFGDLPRIELFARQRVEGWDAWGNEVESTVQMDSRPAARWSYPGCSMHHLGNSPAGQVPGPQGPTGYTGPGNLWG